MFVILSLSWCSDVADELLQSRVKYKEAVKNMPVDDQEFYHQTEATDMFTAFYQSRKWVGLVVAVVNGARGNIPYIYM